MAKSVSEQIARRCVHFTGIYRNECCEVGVKYDDVRDTAASPYRFACFSEHADIPCAARRFPTPEEAAAEEAEIEAHMNKTMLAMKAAHDDAKSRGLKKGNGGTGSIKCPCCETGTLGYSVAAYNGHLWGKCSTEGCTSWMQ